MPKDKKAFNPNLSNREDFQKWYAENTLEGKQGIPYSDSLDYDYLSYFMNGDHKGYGGGHFPDTYKRPDHETFSEESIYSTPENPGGTWIGEQFNPNSMAKSKKYESGGNTRRRAVAVSYDMKGNPIAVPQNYQDFQNLGNPQTSAPPQPINIDVGNGQSVTQSFGYNPGSQFRPLPNIPAPAPAPSQMSYSRSPDGGYLINTDYLNNYMNGGKRGYDAYGTYDRNTNRKYANEGLYGSRMDLNDVSIFENGGSLSPSKAMEILHDGKINGKKITDKQRKYFGAISNQAQNGMSFNNPFTDDRQFNYGSSVDYMRYANQGPNQPVPQLQSVPLQQMPVDNTVQAQPMTNAPASSQMDNSGGGSNYGSIAGGIQSGVEAIGGLFSGANDLRNQIIMGGGALINGLLKDQHNVRKKVPVMADQTLAYQPQYNNMMENGGNMQQPGFVVNTAYQPGQEVELSPEQVRQLKLAGYEFEILG